MSNPDSPIAGGGFLYSIPSIVSATSSQKQGLLSNPFTRMANNIDVGVLVQEENDDDIFSEDDDSMDYVGTQIACTQADDHVLRAQQEVEENETEPDSEAEESSESVPIDTMDIGLLSAITKDNSVCSSIQPGFDPRYGLPPFGESPIITGETVSSSTLSKSGSLMLTAEAEAILAGDESEPPKESLYAQYLSVATNAATFATVTTDRPNEVLGEEVGTRTSDQAIDVLKVDLSSQRLESSLQEPVQDLIGADHLPGLGFSQTQDSSDLTRVTVAENEFFDLPGLGFSQTVIDVDNSDHTGLDKTSVTGLSSTPRSQIKISILSPVAHKSPMKHRLGFSQSQTSQPPLFDINETLNAVQDASRPVFADQGPSTASAPTQLSPSPREHRSTAAGVDNLSSTSALEMKSNNNNAEPSKMYHLSPVQANLMDFIPRELRDVEICSDLGTVGSPEVSVRDINSISFDRPYSAAIEEDDVSASAANAFAGNKISDNFVRDFSSSPAVGGPITGSAAIDESAVDKTIIDSDDWLDARAFKSNAPLPFCEPTTTDSTCKTSKKVSENPGKANDTSDMHDVSADEDMGQFPNDGFIPGSSHDSLSQTSRLAVSDLLFLSKTVAPANDTKLHDLVSQNPEKSKGPLLTRVFKSSEKKLVRLKRKSGDHNFDLSDDDGNSISEEITPRKEAVKHIRFQDNAGVDEEEAEWTPHEDINASHHQSVAGKNINGVDKLSEKVIPGDVPKRLLSSRQNLGNFRLVWAALEEVGWTWQKGKDLIDFYYIRPGKRVSTKQPTTDIFLSIPTESPDYFFSTDDVLAYVKHCIENFESEKTLAMREKTPQSVTSSRSTFGDQSKGKRSPLSSPSTSSHFEASSDWSNESLAIVQDKISKYSTYPDEDEIDSVLVCEDLPAGLCAYIDQAEPFFSTLVLL